MGIAKKAIRKMWRVFRARKVTVNLPAFHQQSTTNSPSKHHAEMPVFANTPGKNGHHSIEE
jgi:hypothetical protein